MTLVRRDFLKGAPILCLPSMLLASCGGSTGSSESPPSGSSSGTGENPLRSAQSGELRELEHRLGGRVGVAAYYQRVELGGLYPLLHHRADERFALCSTFKWALAALTLRQVELGTLILDSQVEVEEADLLEYAPVTRARFASGDRSLTVQELCEAIVTVSDNTAANLLLRETGGPPALTDFFRSLGDSVTHLDRTEPELNTNIKGDERDTTTPANMARALARALNLETLNRENTERLSGWLENCQTGQEKLRAGLPASVKVGDKTGSGQNNASCDVAVVWLPSGERVFIASYLSESVADLATLNAAHAQVAKLSYQAALQHGSR